MLFHVNHLLADISHEISSYFFIKSEKIIENKSSAAMGLRLLNSFLASCIFFSFPNSLDLDQDRHSQNVGPDLDPNSLTL